MKKYIGLKETSELLGVSTKTLQRWDSEGRLVPFKTDGGHRRYSYDKIINYYEDNSNQKDKITICYCRVSTKGQEDDLNRQIETLSNYCAAKGYQFKTIKDIGSGLNYKKNGLKELITLITNKEISRVVINYKDRLVRYGYEIIELLCEQNNISIEIVNQSEDKTFEQELVDDVLSLITVFSAKLYGSRSRKGKKLVNETKKIINED